MIRAPGDDSRAIAVTDVTFAGGDPRGYNVILTGPTEAFNVYGEFGEEDLPFDNFDTALAAVTAVSQQLTDAGGIEFVGNLSAPVSNEFFNLVYRTEQDGLIVTGFLARAFADQDSDGWFADPQSDQALYNLDSRVYADFSVVPVPAAVWLFGSALVGLVGIAYRRKQIA